MKKLLDHLQRNFCEYDGSICIDTVIYDNPSVKLSLSINLDDQKPKETWIVSCEQSFREHLNFEFVDTINISQESPLLVPFVEDELTLTFVENDVESMELLGIVQKCCRERMGNMVSIDDYLNTHIRDYAICSSSYGQLGKFPRSVAESIMERLDSRPIRLTVSQEFPPVYWDGNAHVSYPDTLAVLNIGASWIVGTGFNATKER